MKTRLLIILVSFSLIAFPAIAASNPKAGATCSQIGITQIYKNLKFTCIKSGSKKVWDKGSKVETTSTSLNPDSYVFSSLCDADPFVPDEWKSYQQFALRSDVFGCARPYRFKTVALPLTKPQTPQTNRSELNDVNACKLTHGARSAQIAFWDSNLTPKRINLMSRANIQVIPVEFIDYPSSKTPLEENGKYFDYIKNSYFNLSDGQVNLNFKVPSSYYKINKRIDSYVRDGRIVKNAFGGTISWPNMDINLMLKDISSSVGSTIDFSSTDLVFFVFPPNMKSEYISHIWSTEPQFYTSQGRMFFIYLSPPMSAVNKDSWYGVEPFLHLHEMMHGMWKLDDHDGDGSFGRVDGDAGTGRWGIMSGMMTDFLFWDKWISNMVSDQQIRCAKPNTTSLHWLKPSSYYGIEEKLLVIPVDSSKVLVVESMRAAGFNFKLSPNSEGALVYLVDTTKTQHGRGINVLRPENRSGSIYQVRDFELADAPLKKGDSITSNGYKISVVESGNFGDVVKVEKV